MRFIFRFEQRQKEQKNAERWIKQIATHTNTLTQTLLIFDIIVVINCRWNVFPRGHFHSKNIADFTYLFEDEVEVGAGVGGGDAETDTGGYDGGGRVAYYDDC